MASGPSSPSAVSSQVAGRDSVRETTTMMVGNLPCRLTIEMFSEVLDRGGFKGCYDFVHVVSSSAPGSGAAFGNLGYCFINFGNAELAEEFRRNFDGYTFEGLGSSKKCKVEAAKVQGFMESFAIVARSMNRAKLRGTVLLRL
eukprot:CAMPEP_0175752056 /NCGR_PEP_ID=MMETSP0097-20121207/61558_1 /TAXON_ID=311494 /ORGANISM="Alexandrium monilatum, Strain CCMP3105" /LENGTH=142 /DNA_ID=CAMNT_0017060809 /DNA_START=8 /DNA_END=436 /DNA_ORIENTATION=+